MLDYEIFKCIEQNKDFIVHEYNSHECLIYKSIDLNNFNAFVKLFNFVDKYHVLVKCLSLERVGMIKHILKNINYKFLSRSSTEYCLYLSLKNEEIFKIMFDHFYLNGNKFEIINVFSFDLKSVKEEMILYVYEKYKSDGHFIDFIRENYKDLYEKKINVYSGCVIC